MKGPEGHLHPLTIVSRKIMDIFTEMGFELPDGPEVESEYYNFDALNIPANHPARDMWDTFWLRPKEGGKLLRTHTSPVQARYMEKNEPPIAIVSIGKTYRYEDTNTRKETTFHQVEGLLVDKDINLSHLKGIFAEFLKRIFNKEVEVRFRVSYFPFVEPGIEVDMTCFSCDGAGCGMCKKTGWLEILGAGMVHPNVLSRCGINPNVYQGFAFGMGLERIAMLLYGIEDVRLFHSGDLRLVRQFRINHEN